MHRCHCHCLMSEPVPCKKCGVICGTQQLSSQGDGNTCLKVCGCLPLLKPKMLVKYRIRGSSFMGVDQGTCRPFYDVQAHFVSTFNP